VKWDLERGLVFPTDEALRKIQLWIYHLKEYRQVTAYCESQKAQGLWSQQEHNLHICHPARNESSVDVVNGIQEYNLKQMCSDYVRQHHSGVIYQMTGRDSFHTPIPIDSRIIPVGSGKSLHIESNIHSRSTECPIADGLS
jgi:hypothetical protein